MPIRPVDKKPWRSLLGTALAIAESVERSGYGKLDFRLGGGTVLMLRFDHRLSRANRHLYPRRPGVEFITPRLNEFAERVSTGYEQQANAIKLVLPEGDIDFIVAGPVIPGGAAETLVFQDRAIPLDTTAEILAKKLLYRADSFKARDVFDMATTLASSARRSCCRTRCNPACSPCSAAPARDDAAPLPGRTDTRPSTDVVRTYTHGRHGAGGPAGARRCDLKRRC